MVEGEGCDVKNRVAAVSGPSGGAHSISALQRKSSCRYMESTLFLGAAALLAPLFSPFSHVHGSSDAKPHAVV
jgi:hypothetical protein